MSKSILKGPQWAKAPFPWFGGKRDAAPAVWRALGDVHHYVEPFLGSAAVLVNRPHQPNRTYYSETVNDLDLHLTNFWRSVARYPEEVAAAASYPVSEVDLLSRHMALVRWATDPAVRNDLTANPESCYPKEAGWWVWGCSAWIGSGWCRGDGPWRVNDAGQVECMPRRKKGDASKREPGVSSQLPHLGDDGKGIHSPQLREPGVSSQLPHLGNDGKGIHHAGLREPGVSSKLPHLGNNGKGIHHAGLREPGVSSQLPHLGNNGQGIISPQLREPGVAYHELTMPKALEWIRWLSARLRHVRILCGDWERALTPSASITLSVRGKKDAACGVFLDPPYDMGVGRDAVYNHESHVSPDVRAWCLANGDSPKYRIVLAGYDTEHVELEQHGWRVVEWFKSGFLKGGMGNLNKGGGRGSQSKRERLWLSPHCLSLDEGETGAVGGQQLLIDSEVQHGSEEDGDDDGEE